MERLFKLHLGCGRGENEKYWPGFVNHDSEVDLKNLDYADECVSEIHLIHVFEHLPRAEIGEFLDEWRRVLVPGGLLVLEMPSMDKIAKLILQGETRERLTLLGIFGDVYSGDDLMLHRWCWTQSELASVLSGWEVKFLEPVYHMKQRDIRVECRRVK